MSTIKAAVSVLMNDKFEALKDFLDGAFVDEKLIDVGDRNADQIEEATIFVYLLWLAVYEVNYCGEEELVEPTEEEIKKMNEDK